MGASSTNDCIGYINKLENFGTNYSPGKLLVRPRGSGYPNTNWYFDDHRGDGYQPNGLLARDAVTSAGIPESSTYYVSNGAPYITRGTNVAGYFALGFNGGLGA